MGFLQKRQDEKQEPGFYLIKLIFVGPKKIADHSICDIPSHENHSPEANDETNGKNP